MGKKRKRFKNWNPGRGGENSNGSKIPRLLRRGVCPSPLSRPAKLERLSKAFNKPRTRGGQRRTRNNLEKKTNQMKRKLAKVFFIISALVILASVFSPFFFVIHLERIDLGRVFLDLWPFYPIPITAGVILWLSYEYLNATEKTSL